MSSHASLNHFLSKLLNIAQRQFVFISPFPSLVLLYLGQKLSEADCQVSSDGASQYGTNWLTGERGISPYEFTRWFVVEITNNEERAWIYQPPLRGSASSGTDSILQESVGTPREEADASGNALPQKMKNRTTTHYVTRKSVAIISQISARYGKMRTKKRTEQRKEV